MMASTLSVSVDTSVLSWVEAAASALTATARVVRTTCGVQGRLSRRMFVSEENAKKMGDSAASLVASTLRSLVPSLSRNRWRCARTWALRPLRPAAKALPRRARREPVMRGGMIILVRAAI